MNSLPERGGPQPQPVALLENAKIATGYTTLRSVSPVEKHPIRLRRRRFSPFQRLNPLMNVRLAAVARQLKVIIRLDPLHSSGVTSTRQLKVIIRLDPLHSSGVTSNRRPS